MLARFRLLILAFVLAFMPVAGSYAQEHAPAGDAPTQVMEKPTEGEAPAGEGGKKLPSIRPEFGTWFSPLVRAIGGIHETPHIERDKGGVATEVSGETFDSIHYDYLFLAVVAMLGIAAAFGAAAKKGQLRPTGKATSSANAVEAMVDGFRNYVIGIMGDDLGAKYSPLISAFFFTILFFNYVGLIPGLISPSANLNTTVGLALVAFVATHFIAIKEVGVGNWFKHFIGEPLWLAPLNLPLHLIGEVIKPASLAIRLMCNIFGEEMVAGKLVAMAVGLMGLLYLPIPLQLPMLLLGTFFGALQALVFSTLLAIYISILGTHHDHGHDNGHLGHVEHDRHGTHAVPEQGSLA